MSHVRDPVGETWRWQALGDARAGAQILARNLRLLEGHLRLADRLELLALAGRVVAAPAGGDEQANTNSGNEEGQDLVWSSHGPSIALRGVLVTLARYSGPKWPELFAAAGPGPFIARCS